MVDDPKKLAVWLTTPNHIFVEIAHDLGYSKFLLDIEHGLFDLEPTDRLIAFIIRSFPRSIRRADGVEQRDG